MSTALDATTDHDPAANVGPRQDPTVFKNARARAAAQEAWLRRTGRRHDPDDPDGRSSPMRSSSLIATIEIGRPAITRSPRVARPPDEEARRRETRREAATYPDEKRSDAFRALSV